MKNQEFTDRLNKVIPGGAHTYSRGDDQFPSNAPQILEKGIGAYVWSPDGRKFLDYGMALRAVTLGYSDPQVTEAVCNEIRKGNNLTRASVTELEAAELIVDLIPSADMVKFAKNGSNVTTAAAKIARAYTGKKYICVPRQHPFFSFDDWFIGTTPLLRGIPSIHYESTLIFDYGDISSLEILFESHPGEIAGVMLEPATTILPINNLPEKLIYNKSFNKLCQDCSCTTHCEDNFLNKVQSLCRKNNCLFILDEMITGFRFHEQGAQVYFGVDPDITTFGKAMANGFSVSALVGKREIMEMGSIRNIGAERTFLLSTTHGGEMSGLRAFIETMNIYKEREVCSHLWSYGAQLRNGLIDLAKELGIENNFRLDGASVLMNYVTLDEFGKSSFEYRTLFSQEMIRNGVLFPWISLSLSHGSSELDQTLEAARKAFKVYQLALSDGIGKYLEGPAIKPVFRKYN